jgi:hypothetical protein
MGLGWEAPLIAGNSMLRISLDGHDFQFFYNTFLRSVCTIPRG